MAGMPVYDVFPVRRASIRRIPYMPGNHPCFGIVRATRDQQVTAFQVNADPAYRAAYGTRLRMLSDRDIYSIHNSNLSPGNRFTHDKQLYMFDAGTKIPHPDNDIRIIVTFFQSLPPLKSVHPRYWPTWLGIAILRLLVFLPFRVQFKIGAALGRLLYRFAHRRRHIASVNLALCFPALSEPEREKLLIQHFESLGIAVFEVGLAWWASRNRLEKMVSSITGLEHVRSALASGQGVIMLTAHFTCLEIAGRIFGVYLQFHALYRTHENPVLEYLIQRYRNMHLEKAIPRENIRAMLKTLQSGKAVWYLQDQNYGHKNKVFVPFFGVEAATTPATSRMARFSNAVVIPCFGRRKEDYSGYEMTILPPLQDFPGEDDLEDTKRLAGIVERQVRKAPAQYLWSHRRFKDRPEGQDSFY